MLGVLVRTGRIEVSVRRNRGDVDVAPSPIAEGLGQGAHLSRDVGRGIDRRVPSPLGESREIAIAVAKTVLQVIEKLRVGPAPVKEGHLITLGDQRINDVATDELRAADYENLHRACSHTSPSKAKPTAYRRARVTLVPGCSEVRLGSIDHLRDLELHPARRAPAVLIRVDNRGATSLARADGESVSSRQRARGPSPRSRRVMTSPTNSDNPPFD